MVQKVPKPSVIRIIESDYTALSAVLFPTIIWVMYVAIEYFGFFPSFRGRDSLTGESAPFFLNFAIIVTLICIPLLIWRVHFFKKLFSKGVEVPGLIANIWFHRDRGRVEYTYTYQGKTYHRGNAIMKSGRTKTLTYLRHYLS